ncbi:hypothetical protein DFH09DRAFT_1070371 [Mycena vulgaris]|nr:hypothetical protein DFH09DRAFT_1070371 [Mycena vulgaris]
MPLNFGRVDTTEPNLPSVPEPEQTLDSHIATFAKQGFTPDGMIGLVACGELFARMLDTVPSGVQLSDVITPLPVKPSNLKFTLDGDILQFSDQVRWHCFFGKTTSEVFTIPPCFPRWSTSYIFGDDSSGRSLDAAAGIMNMRFMVDGKLEDRGGVGFAVQDAVVFSTTSCFFGNNLTAQYKLHIDPVQVCKGVNVTSVYVETQARDSSGHVAITETNFFLPDSTVAVNSAYSIWTLGELKMSRTDWFFSGSSPKMRIPPKKAKSWCTKGSVASFCPSNTIKEKYAEPRKRAHSPEAGS